MTHWLGPIVDLLTAETDDLRELALMSRRDPTTFYVGASLDGVDIRGQDVRGLRFTDFSKANLLADEATLADEEPGRRTRSTVGNSPVSSPDILELSNVPDDPIGWEDIDPSVTWGSGLGQAGSPLCVIDLGAARVAAIIASPEPADGQPPLPVRSVAVVRSQGLRGGALVGLDDVARSIGHAVERAERAAGAPVSGAIVATAIGQIGSERVRSRVSLGAQPVADSDLARAIAMALAQVRASHRQAIHILPIAWQVDGRDAVKNPLGQRGGSLSLDLLVVTMDGAAINSIFNVCELAHLDLQGIAAAPLVGALSVLTPDEQNGRTVCIDIGHHTMGVAVLEDRAITHVSTLKGGGANLSAHIATSLKLPMAVAATAKRSRGASRVKASPGERVFVALGDVQADIDVSLLDGAIHTGLLDLLNRLSKHLSTHDISLRHAAVVLIGGASRMMGLEAAVADFFDCRVRLGAPLPWPPPHDLAEASLASAIGGVQRAFHGPREAVSARKLLARMHPRPPAQPNVVQRAAAWLRQNL